ncbi:MAG TPA: magnesium transporter [Phycisphaerae bacterium]|jgi:magnesium transporter|nr:magnesium transporter [Phycisphaerae bacterium]
MIGNILQAELEELIHGKRWEELRDALAMLEPADIAELIVDLPPEDEGIIFRVLTKEQAAAAFSYLPLEHQEGLIQSISSETSRVILDQMTPDDRVRLLEEMPAEVTRRLLEVLSPEELKETRRILNYPENSAGRYLTPEYVALQPGMTAREALEYVRTTGRGKETLNVLYVVESGKLIAELRLGTLVMADPNAQVRDIKDRSLVSLQATASRDEMVDTFKKYDRVALPVTDNQGNMLGIITADDVLDVAQQEATEDIQKMGGQEALDAPYLTVSFWSMVKKRGGWLAVLFLGEMLTATAMGSFEGEIEKAAVVALFVPLIISSGGNSGSQGTSLIIRSLALRELRLRDWWRVFGREIRTGLALGLFLGIIGFARIAAWQGLSHVPVMGSFFTTEAERELATIPQGMKMVYSETDLTAPLHIPASTLPAGTKVRRGLYLPQETVVPADMTVVQSNPDFHPTAYGRYWFLVGLTVLVALVGVVGWGSLAGSMLPFILRALGFDPATSSAPFVATLVDVTGLIIYFLVAKLILSGTLL